MEAEKQVEEQELKDRIKDLEDELQSSRQQMTHLEENYSTHQKEYQRVVDSLNKSTENIAQLEKRLSEENALSIENANKQELKHVTILNEAKSKITVLEQKVLLPIRRHCLFHFVFWSLLKGGHVVTILLCSPLFRYLRWKRIKKTK